MDGIGSGLFLLFGLPAMPHKDNVERRHHSPRPYAGDKLLSDFGDVRWQANVRQLPIARLRVAPGAARFVVHCRMLPTFSDIAAFIATSDTAAAKRITAIAIA